MYNTNNRLLSQCYSSPMGSGCSNNLILNNQSARYINFAGGAVDLQQVLFMRDANVTFAQNI